MILTFRPIKVWPEHWNRDPAHPAHPFDATWTDTLDLLDRELRMLSASDPILQVDATEGQCRLDGQLRADARVEFPGVIVSFQTPRYGTLSYPCDKFGPRWRSSLSGWQANVRAVAKGLESLRRVERYGIAERGQQYAGWAELPSGIAMGQAMTVDEAIVILREGAAWAGDFDPLFDTIHIETAYKMAAKRHHPDAGGDPKAFRRITEARDLLKASAR